MIVKVEPQDDAVKIIRIELSVFGTPISVFYYDMGDKVQTIQQMINIPNAGIYLITSSITVVKMK